jgi:hypothetical protein
MENTKAYQRMLTKARQVANGGKDAWYCMSTGEQIAVALVLNRADWLEETGYTIAQGLDRIGTDWMICIFPVAQAIEAGGS